MASIYDSCQDPSQKRRNQRFTPEEDKKLKRLVNNFGETAWDDIAELMDGRNARQCHDRWTSYLSPNINKAPWTPEEDRRIVKLQPHFKGKWVEMSKRFKGRTDIQLRNRWNVLKKRLVKKPNVNKITEKISKQKKPIRAVNAPITTAQRNVSGVFEQLFALFDEPIEADFTFNE